LWPADFAVVGASVVVTVSPSTAASAQTVARRMISLRVANMCLVPCELLSAEGTNRFGDGMLRKSVAGNNWTLVQSAVCGDARSLKTSTCACGDGRNCPSLRCGARG